MTPTANDFRHPAVVRGVSRGEPSYRFHERYEAALWSSPWQVPLFRELRDGRLLMCDRGLESGCPRRAILICRLCCCWASCAGALKGSGPAAVPALRWSGGNIVIHDETPLADEYVAPLAKAHRTGRLMIVATSAEHTAGWHSLAVKVIAQYSAALAAPGFG